MDLMRCCVVLLIAATSLSAQETGTNPDPFAQLRTLAGEWRGVSNGEPGNGAVTRTYEFVLKDRFLQVRNTSVYPPQQKNKSGEKHDDLGIISFDKQRKKLVYRQFHVEGFTNTYVQQESPEPNKIVFVSEAIENIAPGWRARETWTFVGPNEFVERFELAEPGKEFQLYTESHLLRVK